MPRVLAAYIRLESTCLKAAKQERYISGNEMATAAITVADQLNTILTPKNSSRNLPKGLFTPNTIKRKPATVGGKTIGRVRILSMINVSLLPLCRYNILAQSIPSKNVNTMLSDAVLKILELVNNPFFPLL